MSFRNQIEANWTATACVAFVILTAPIILENLGKSFYALVALPLLLGFVLKVFLFMPKLTAQIVDSNNHRIHEIIYWKNEKIPRVERLCGSQMIVADSYQIAAKLSFYLNEKIPALHYNSRKSHYTLLNLHSKIKNDQKICFITSSLRQKSIRVETFYKDPMYVVPDTTLGMVKKINGEL